MDFRKMLVVDLRAHMLEHFPDTSIRKAWAKKYGFGVVHIQDWKKEHYIHFFEGQGRDERTVTSLSSSPEEEVLTILVPQGWGVTFRDNKIEIKKDQ